MPDKRVFLHIGAPKTGTTFLQEVMWRNRGILADSGVLFPYADPKQHFRSARDFCGQGWAALPKEHFSGEWAAVADVVRRWDGPTVIVSNELLGAADPDRIGPGLSLLEPAELHVVLTLRDLARQMVSGWQEDIKHRHLVTLEDFVELLIADPDHGADSDDLFWKHHDAEGVLANWREFVPAERIHLVTGPQPGSPPGELWRRFAAVVGIDSDRLDTSARRANRSLGVAEAELIRRLNAELGDMKPHIYDPLVRVYLAQEVLGNQSARLTLPPHYMHWALTRSRHLVAALEAAGYAVEGDLSELMPRPADHVPHVSPTALSTRDLGDAAGRATIGLLHRAGEQRQTILDLNSRLTGREQPEYTDRSWTGRIRFRRNRARQVLGQWVRDRRLPRRPPDDSDLL